MLLTLSGCGKNDDNSSVIPVSTNELVFTIDGVTVASPPVVDFTVTDENGSGFTGLTENDLRFNIAKLIPKGATGTGDPSAWQNYIVLKNNGVWQGSQERMSSGYSFGTLVNHNDGSYTYTFATDITSPACGPCTDDLGNTIDLSYDNTLTHRLTIQQGNKDLPLANAVFDFVPAGGPLPETREIVKTANCNECHDKLIYHGSRYETKLCVTCHNPGTRDENNVTADMKVMIHKLHRGEDLPSVNAGGSYVIGGHDFSDVVFPQDIRNCTKCHDGSDPDTPQGDNWEAVPNLTACNSCHDDVDFATGTNHFGGVQTDNSGCAGCHFGGACPTVVKSHLTPGSARGLFQFNILEICGTAVNMNPVCSPGTPVTMKFSVTDPLNATHEYGNAYNIVAATTTDTEFSSGASSLNMLTAWDTRDYTNDGGSGSRPSRADSVNLRTSASVVDNGDGTFTVTGDPIPSDAAGSGAIAIEGHPASNIASCNGYTSTTTEVNVPADSVVEYFAITDATPQPRRQVVDVPTMCDNCHDVLSVHGSNRNNDGQLCVLCHNPSGTDVGKRPKNGGLPDASATLDGKAEESIDFKRLIHGIHAGAMKNYDGTNAHGFRNKGLVVYAYGGGVHDYSDVRFPGVLSKCETCHLEGTNTLSDRSAIGGGNWEQPSMNGIFGSTVHSYPSADPATADFDGTSFSDALIDQSDDYKYSPIASVCSACHDGDQQKAHMRQYGAIFGGAGSEQAVQQTNFEACAGCHGPGRLADVELVHD